MWQITKMHREQHGHEAADDGTHAETEAMKRKENASFLAEHCQAKEEAESFEGKIAQSLIERRTGKNWAILFE